MTHLEIGKELNISHATVRQIERQALAKLKRYLTRKQITLDDLIDLDRPNGKAHSLIANIADFTD